MVDVIVDKQDTECTIWSVAPVSIIQVLDLYACLLTIRAEKMECEGLGGNQKGLLEKLVNIRHGRVGASSSSSIGQW